ncbi:SusD/RagB family nutrient-binding outer membrane lipoprotein [Flavobacterium sp.]|jgi:hypothetical protein|uniref:SusD/RagB family nutrient-binding outer membrane lipoprotein n=1 Tax=Flavobacterium sp. TaxID=239 RepID=UPI002A7EDB8D|nr:SusD/RagB family nutrient-binding outer membrane lipoprotein [Flavobacterium sp.]
MKKLKLILPLIAFTLFSCDNYLDVNTSPNNPQASQITPNLTLAAAQSGSYSPLVRRMNELGNVFMNNWGANVNSFTGGYAEEFGITMSNNFYEDIWNSVYRSTYEYSNIINHPSADYDNHKAIAKIMKSFYFQYLVDLYGDVPYFEAHLGTANTNPAYDDDQVIYRDLIVQLDAAIAMIDNAPANTIAVGAEDVMLGGNMNKWKKFANTLKLRILLREATKAETDAASATYLATQFAALDQDFITEDLIINPGYSDASNVQQNPWMNLMVELKLTTTGAFTYRSGYNFRRASDYIAGRLNASPTDPRRGRLFKLLGGTVVGVKQGDFSGGTGTAPGAMSELGPGVIVSSGQDGYVMLAAESYLLQAEAAERGFISGSPQALFNAGITASFAHLGASLGTYVSDVNTENGKGYAASTDKIQAIMYQKSIALCNTNGLEAWIEYTRTGYINNIPMPLGSSSPTGQKPLRLMYPTSELASNSANVPAQTVNDAFTTAPFWK